MDVDRKIEQAKNTARLESVEWERERREAEIESNKRRDEITYWLKRHARKISGVAYNKWLRAYLEAGESTHCYDYDSNRWDWYELTETGTIPSACGSMSVNILVPGNLGLSETNENSHNSIFYWHDLRTNGCTVPVFSDS